MWKCVRCGAENPGDTLECRKCKTVDPSATREELAAWRKALKAETRPGPNKRVALTLVVLVLVLPILWQIVIYCRDLPGTRRFDAAASCDGVNGPGTPSPPCGAEVMQIDGVHSTGYMARVPRNPLSRRWQWLSFTVYLTDPTGRRRTAGLQDKTTLDIVDDESQVTAVEYEGRLVGLNVPSGDFKTTDNPDSILDMDRANLRGVIIFALLIVAGFAAVGATGRIAEKRLRQLRGSGR